jgi:methionine--tRNA ligase beta chain
LDDNIHSQINIPKLQGTDNIEDASKREVKKDMENVVEDVPAVDKLDIRCGHVLSVRKHEQADTLYILEVDVGEKIPRILTSSLIKYLREDQLQDKDVIILCNLEVKRMLGVDSQAMILAAKDQISGWVDLLQPPPNSMPGEICRFGSIMPTSMEVLNPKQKIWQTVQGHLKTDVFHRITFITIQNGIRNVNILRTDRGDVTVERVSDGRIF